MTKIKWHSEQPPQDLDGRGYDSLRTAIFRGHRLTATRDDNTRDWDVEINDEYVGSFPDLDAIDIDMFREIEPDAEYPPADENETKANWGLF